MSSPTWIGQTLNERYVVNELLGQGGMSAVYKALDPNLKRVVAIKLIHPHLAVDNQFIQRFEEEAAAVASLRHANIVQVFDFSSDKGVSYMVLEFIPGETLQDHLKRLAAQNRSMSVEQAIKITINMCDALGYAHQRGMIHRDIKPANIMLDVYGQAILMDFGIVKIIGGSQHTATGAVMGTARYMSPELIRAEPADARSDIYSLGVTLYEMLSGRTPFSADSAMTLMMMHLNDPVPDPRLLRADLPPELVRILNKALAKERSQRYQGTAEFAADLKNVLAGLAQAAAPAADVTVLPANPQGKAPASVAVEDSATLYEQRLPVRAAANPTPPSGYPPQYQNVSGAHISPPQHRKANEGYIPHGSAAPIPATQYQNVSATPILQPQNQKANSALIPPPALEPESGGKKNRSLFLILGIGGAALLLLLVLVVGGILVFSRQSDSQKSAAAPGVSAGEASPSPTLQSDLGFNATLTALALAALQPSATPTATSTPQPTETPTATLPSLYVRINSISINAEQRYVVDYETFGYTEELPGRHVHFFFNTVTADQAGMPGSGPWYLYGGPRPFTGYRVSDKPAAATQMCALVANSDHSIILESGNCVALP
jgi:serine/threonine protein kinase